MTAQIDDLSRDVYCLLGIPVDAIGMREAVDRIEWAIQTRSPFLISTPNINFIVNAARDTSFKEAVAFSDLCLPDGMWLVRLGRLLGIPIKDRVSGADILETAKLRRTEENPLNVYFFGGPEGAGERASEAINARKDGLHCAGSANPGFVSIEKMSADDLLSAVHSSQADFLSVALGAKKGQLWLYQNHKRLTIPVRAHLGASINFYAGSVRRAPRVLQRWGLEWAWRIKEEPLLWRRYAYDGMLIGLMFFYRVAPLLLWSICLRLQSLFDGEHLSITQMANRSQRVVALSGSLTSKNIDAIASALRSAILAGEDVAVDLSGARAVDARFAGLLLMLQKTMGQRGRRLYLDGAPPFIRWLLGLYGFPIPDRAPELKPAPASSAGVAAE